jgi:hypothetical protein
MRELHSYASEPLALRVLDRIEAQLTTCRRDATARRPGGREKSVS